MMADFIKKHKHALILGGIGLGVLLFFSSRARKEFGEVEDFGEKELGRIEDFAEMEASELPTYQSLLHKTGHKGNPISKAYAGYMNRENPGIDNLDNNVNQVPGAAGANAMLNPSEYSYLTQRNRNALLSNLGHIPLTGGPSRNFDHIRFQGSWGLTGPIGQGFNTYW